MEIIVCTSQWSLGHSIRVFKCESTAGWSSEALPHRVLSNHRPRCSDSAIYPIHTPRSVFVYLFVVIQMIAATHIVIEYIYSIYLYINILKYTLGWYLFRVVFVVRPGNASSGLKSAVLKKKFLHSVFCPAFRSSSWFFTSEREQWIG